MSNHYHFRHSIYEYIIKIFCITKLKHAHNALEILNQILNQLIQKNKLNKDISYKDGLNITIQRLIEVANNIKKHYEK